MKSKEKEKIASKYQHLQLMYREYLRAHRLRFTNERGRILMYCCELEAPFTIEQLVELAQAEKISRVTVYNNLHSLIEAHILQVVTPDLGRATRRFELVPHSPNRSRFICTRCGRTRDFRDSSITNILKNRMYTNFQMETYSVYVYGTCKICRKLKS